MNKASSLSAVQASNNNNRTKNGRIATVVADDEILTTRGAGIYETQRMIREKRDKIQKNPFAIL